MHVVLTPLPVTEKLPAAHTPLPLLLPQPARQYRPPGHALQDAFVPLPAVAKLPALQSPLPLDELQPARQYAPAGHARQAIDPLFWLYVPAGHAVQEALVPLPAVE